MSSTRFTWLVCALSLFYGDIADLLCSAIRMVVRGRSEVVMCKIYFANASSC